MTFIVAEIGVNWDGNIVLLEEMISKAKELGCDAVKFQSFNKDVLENHPESLRLLKSSISKNNVEKVNNIAKKVGIEWFCTPMYPEAVDILEPYVNRYKIRFGDGRILLENKTFELFDRILETKKEIIISSQASLCDCKYYGNPSLKWLYCVPKYPCSFTDLNFNYISDFNGFSNHCPRILAPLTAAILGAEIIEIHLTSDKSKDFIDNVVSFDYNELKQLNQLIRDSEKIKK